jgi:ATP-binding cassette subfamily B protein
LRAGIIRRFAERNAGLLRQTEYLESCITGKEYMKETRTLGAIGFFFGMLLDSMRRYNEASLKTERRVALIELFLRFVNVLGYAGILALLVYFVADGSVSVGAFASVFYSLERMNGLLRDTVEYFGDLLRELGTASFTHEFLVMPKEEGSDKALDKKADIRVEGVSFAYPGGGKALNDVTLTIARGETLAIVGENGAGKTTLAKIIIGLYNPASGVVRYGGEDIGGYVARSRFGRVSAVFQDFIRYKLTARENITISDAEAGGDAEKAIADSGARLAYLPDGLDTMLSREFDGTELSGGQWQRVAIARGLYRDHDIIVLDEPTAAIDPIEESSVFRLFKESARGKTAILVTHRLGSAKIADRIALMEDGEIGELGTHEQLIARGGKYARMYREQAGWYER